MFRTRINSTICKHNVEMKEGGVNGKTISSAIGKSIEIWSGTKMLVFCSSYKVPTFSKPTNDYLTCLEKGTLQMYYQLWNTVMFSEFSEL